MGRVLAEVVNALDIDVSGKDTCSHKEKLQTLNIKINFRALFGQCLFALSGLILSTVIAAQTMVSGQITTNTHWAENASPYVLEGNVTLLNNAILTVDPGVTIYMGQGANLSVLNASLQISGKAEKPVYIQSDKTRQGQAAMPGDWNNLLISASANNTQLEHVVIEHGSGLIINGSSPKLNYLNIRNHQGAAITIDLAASPSGVGNQASGNTINGIVVPAGTISGNTKWELRGIPYLLQSGTISVGAPPTINTVVPEAIQQGTTATFTVTGTRLSGLSEATFDQEGLSAEVLSGTTLTQGKLSITANAEAIVGEVGLRLLVDQGRCYSRMHSQ